MKRAYYSNPIQDFLSEDAVSVLGALAEHHRHDLDQNQKLAWLQQIDILKKQCSSFWGGHIFFEFSIPRMGKRADVVLLSKGNIYILEFKVGATAYDRGDLDQVYDYALDLKNFHAASHDLPIIPVLVATEASDRRSWHLNWSADHICIPLCCNQFNLGALISEVSTACPHPAIDVAAWQNAPYKPTPTIIEAAQALYQSHNVVDISRSDASAKNLAATADCIGKIIDTSKVEARKSICFVTGVPGAGKTLAGLNIATSRTRVHEDEHAVFLSGNGPLVNVLREALARDQKEREHISKNVALLKVKSFVQNIHHFRDEYLKMPEAPIEKVVVFDEAQRAWTQEKAEAFMRRERGQNSFDMSEPEFLISIMNRHTDWCTVVCLIGEGQEINTGEAGLVEWLTALKRRFQGWDVYISPHASQGNDAQVSDLLIELHAQEKDALHLSVSMRSFRAEELSAFVGCIVDNDVHGAKDHYQKIKDRYPIKITRCLSKARSWLRTVARGTERYGLVASSGAHRLRPEGVHVRSETDAVTWFLNGKSDVRSSYYLEDVATEFDIQGLELDWVCVCWDADYRYLDGAWGTYNFKGTKWQNVNEKFARLYLKNAYRVLLTRARQGMVIFVPNGDDEDPTRPRKFYDQTFAYLASCGIEEI